MEHFKKVFIFTIITFFFAGCARDEPQGLSECRIDSSNY